MINTDYEYVVVKNLEEQYSVWPIFKDIPDGWYSCNFSGTKETCLSYIKEIWVDMRPLSLRKKMEQLSKTDQNTSEQHNIAKVPSLISILSDGKNHPIIILSDNKDKVLNQIQQGYIHIKFTDTIGGSCLTLELDQSITDIECWDNNIINLEGELILDYQHVKCIIEFNVLTLQGHGLLQLK